MQELVASHQQYRAQLDATLGSLGALNREVSVLQATEKELQSSATDGSPVWRGVGKMFLATPVDEYTAQLQQQQREAKERQAALSKKKDYLEVSVQKVQDSLKQIVGGK